MARVIVIMEYIMYQLAVKLMIFVIPEKDRLGKISHAFFTIRRDNIIFPDAWILAHFTLMMADITIGIRIMQVTSSKRAAASNTV